ncbi:MAG: putative efflux system component YknX [Planctomycetota bacterium]
MWQLPRSKMFVSCLAQPSLITAHHSTQPSPMSLTAQPDSSASDIAEQSAVQPRASVLRFVPVALLGVLFGGLWLQSHPTDAQMQGARVQQTVEANGFRSEVVRRARLLRTVPVRGEIATLQPGIVYNDCRYWPRKIVELLPEGTQVQPGDIVCELDSAEIRSKLRDQTLLLIRAKAGWQTALAGETLQQLKNDRRLSSNRLQAQLTQDLSTSFIEAEADQELLQLEGDVTMRREAATMAQESWERTRELTALGINSVAELDIREVEKQNAHRSVVRAAGQLNLTETFHHRKKSSELRFNAQLAADELRRTGPQNELASAVQRVKTLEMQQSVAGLQLHVDYLERALSACTIRAARGGELIYCHNRDEGKYIEIGGTAHYSQELFRIVDRSRMIVTGRVSQSQVFELSVGLPAVVRIPTLPSVELSAELRWIAPISSPISWFAPNDLFNAVQLELPGSDESVASIAFGTTATCEIVVVDRPDVLQIPVQAVFRNGQQTKVLLAGSTGVLQRTVVTGMCNESRVEIVEGLAEGETVLVGEQHRLRRLADSLP